MPVIINGTTGLSGVSTVNLANGSVTQNILANGVSTTGPAFSVSPPGNQSIANATLTKVTLTAEAFDTANCFDTSTYRFTPNVAGYYQINFQFITTQLSGGLFGPLYKNGLRVAIGTIATTVSGVGAVASGSTTLYMNGTTDYLELYGYQTSGGTVTIGNESYLNGFLARAA